MKKALILLALAIILVAQWSFLLSLKSDTVSSSAFGTSAVIVSKAPYMHMRAQITVIPILTNNATVKIIFSNGTQIDVRDIYRFDVVLPKSDKTMGSIVITPGLGVDLTDSHPIDVSVVANVTDTFFTYGIYGGGQQYINNFDVYWFKLQGTADVTINGFGVSL
jgi:hypothetical protein